MDTSIYTNIISGGLIIFILILAITLYRQIKKKKIALNESSQVGQISKIIKNAPFGIYLQKVSVDNTVNRTRGMVIWNKEMTKLFGKSTDTLTSYLKSLCKIEFEDTQNLVLKNLSDVTKNITFNTRKGISFDGLVKLQFITIDNTHYILGVIVNISELKSAINDGIAYHREEKTFLTNISNEICTPLNSIVGLTQLLSKEENSKIIKDYSELINNKSKDLKHMITDVLTLAKLERRELQPKKLTMFIHNAIKEPIKNAKALIKESDKKTFKYCLPYETIKQTFSYELQGFIHNHLLYNAVKFSSKGQIECGMLFEEGKQIIYTYNSFFKPISQEDCIDAFFRFTKLNTFIQGTGIGLTICRMITEYLGGRIGFNGDINNGVLIWVEIPAIYSSTGTDETEVNRIMQFLEARWKGIWFDEKGTLHKPKKKGKHS